jgi:hypothetical protein
VPDDGESRRTITAWYRSIELDEYASDDIFIDLDDECFRYLLGHLAAAETGFRRFISMTALTSSFDGLLGRGKGAFSGYRAGEACASPERGESTEG